MRLIDELPKEAQRAMEHAMNDTVSEMKRQSSGPLDSRQLAALDHPYAKRHGSPMLGELSSAGAPWPTVNVQTGDFLSAWHKEPSIATGDEVKGFVVNDDPKADLLELGTKTMFGRPIQEEGELYARIEFEKRLTQRIEALALRADSL